MIINNPTTRPVPDVARPSVIEVGSADLPANGTPGILVYKCRLCGESMNAYPVLDGPGTLKAIVRNYGELTAAVGDPVKLALSQVHLCPDGRFGVADVVGMSVEGMPE